MLLIYPFIYFTIYSLIAANVASQSCTHLYILRSSLRLNSFSSLDDVWLFIWSHNRGFQRYIVSSSLWAAGNVWSLHGGLFQLHIQRLHGLFILQTPFWNTNRSANVSFSCLNQSANKHLFSHWHWRGSSVTTGFHWKVVEFLIEFDVFEIVSVWYVLMTTYQFSVTN